MLFKNSPAGGQKGTQPNPTTANFFGLSFRTFDVDNDCSELLGRGLKVAKGVIPAFLQFFVMFVAKQTEALSI